MPGNDLQLQISQDVSKAIAGINQVDARLKQLERSVAGVNRANQGFQAGASGAFRGASEHAEKLSTKYRHLGHAIGMAGGEFGHLGHALARVSPFMNEHGAALGRLAAGAAAAGVAYEIFRRYQEYQAEALKKEIELEEEIVRIREKANAASEKSGQSGLEQAEVIGKLTAASGGSSGVQIADDTARRYGLDQSDVRKGVLSSFKLRDPGERDNAIAVAAQAGKAGVKFSEAMDEIIKHPAIRGRLRSNDQQAGLEAADMAVQAVVTGHATQPNVQRLIRTQAAVSANALLHEAATNNTIKGGNQAKDEAAAAAGVGTAPARREAGEKADEFMAAMGAQERNWQIHHDQQKRQLEQNGVWYSKLFSAWNRLALKRDERDHADKMLKEMQDHAKGQSGGGGE